MKLRCIYVDGMSDEGRFILGKEYEVINSYANKIIGKTYKLKDDYEEEIVVPLNGGLWKFEIVREIKMGKKVFKGWEIIKMCEEGLIENGTTLQDLDGGYYTVFDGVVIEGKRKEFDSNYEATSSFFIRNNFRVVKKKYTFEEAYKFYEEGKEIETYDGSRFKKINGQDSVWFDDRWFSFNNAITFSIDRIRNEWYIND